MRASRIDRGGLSAPEGFDDILFGTTGLILVLLTWALTQIGIPEVSKEALDAMAAELEAAQKARSAAEQAAAQERAERATAEARNRSLEGDLGNKKRELESERRRRKRSEEAQIRADAARRRAEAAQKETEESLARAERAKSELEPKPCDVVIALDATKSQDEVLASLRDASVSLSEIGARLSPRFRVGVVVYNGDGVSSFPLTHIGRSQDGQPSEGMRSLIAFLGAVSIVGGAAQVEAALDAAYSMLRGAGALQTRQVVAVLGDVGPWEGGDDIYKIEPPDRESAVRALQKAQEFARVRPQSRLLALFTGKDSAVANKAETIGFFKQVAESAGSRGSYSDGVSQLSATLIEAVFGQ